MNLLEDNKVLHLTIILLRSIAVGELYCYTVMKKKINETGVLCHALITLLY